MRGVNAPTPRMDSAPLAAPAAPPTAVGLAAPAARPALARLGRVLPAVDALVRFSRRTAAVSAVAVAVVVWAVATRAPGISTVDLVGLAVVLLVPAFAALVVGWTLGDLRRLPGDLRAMATEAAGDVGAVGRPRGIAGVLVALWTARKVMLAAGGGWGRAMLAVRLVRLVRLPFVVGALALFALNAVVIAAGAGVALWLLLT